MNFVIDGDIEGFKEYLDSDDTIYFNEPNASTPRPKHSHTAPASAMVLMNALRWNAIHSEVRRKLTFRSLKPSNY